MDDYVRQAVEIVKAQAGVRAMNEEEMSSMVVNLAASLKSMTEAVEAGTLDASDAAPFGDPKKAIKEKSIQCLECGKSFKVLTRKHLETHGISPEEYRTKYGYKKGTALIARALAKARRKKMQEMQLWKKKGMKAGS